MCFAPGSVTSACLSPLSCVWLWNQTTPTFPFNHQLTNMPESQRRISDSSCLLSVHFETLHPQLHCYTYSMVVFLCASRDISATLGANSGMIQHCCCEAPTIKAFLTFDSWYFCPACFSECILFKNYDDCRLFQVHDLRMLTVSIHLFTGSTLNVKRFDKCCFRQHLNETIDAAEVNDQG